MRSFFGAMLCWFCVSLARGADFDAANQLYDQGRFAEAKAAYQELIRTGTPSANLFYNLGCADHRLGVRGEAVLDFQRALALEPGHPEARANLDFLRGEMGAIAWPVSWIDRLLPGAWADVCTGLSAVAGWVAIFMVARTLLFSGRSSAGTWTGVAAALLLSGYCAAVAWHAQESAGRAIVTANAAEARFAPAASAGAAAALPAGSEVRVLQERGDWIYCALPMGGRGWIVAKEIARVRPVAS